MQKNIRIVGVFILVCLVFGGGYSIGSRNDKRDRAVNIRQSQNIKWENGWNNYTSNIGGHAFRFGIVEAKEITLRFSSPDKTVDQGVRVQVADRLYTLASPNLADQTLTIDTSMIATESGKVYPVSVTHYCSGSTKKCEITLDFLSVDGHLTDQNIHTPKKVLAVFGDSLSTGFGQYNYTYSLARILNMQLHNASVNGSTVSSDKNLDHSLNRIDDVIDSKPDIVMILLGTNDVDHATPLELFQKDYTTIVERIRSEVPNSRIVLAGILWREDKPTEIVPYNDVIRNIAKEFDLSFIDTSGWVQKGDFIDGVHPWVAAQTKLTTYFAQALRDAGVRDE